MDGFRVDAVITLFEDKQLRDQPYCDCGETDPTQRDYTKPIYTENLPETYAMVKEWRKVLQEFDDEKYNLHKVRLLLGVRIRIFTFAALSSTG